MLMILISTKFEQAFDLWQQLDLSSECAFDS